ncbi:MAG: tetratricopeptide repeat protein [Muribaculaceae bacterium]|nr:tetratricopeptide repeat protein [Muribaculaceae bacterium]
MKQLVIIILSILLLSACRNREHVQFEKLQHIDSIAEINADSAVAMIKIINRDTLLGNDNKYYFDLLEIRSNDKAYIAHTSDSAILSVINYFENHDFNDLLPVAYYYGGRVYSDLGDAPQALEYFHKALDCPNINSHTMAVAYAQIAGIYNEQKVFDLAIPAYKKAIELNSKNNNYNGIIYNTQGLGNIYSKKEEEDSALILYNEALKLAEKIKNTKLSNSLRLSIGIFHINKNNYVDAYDILSSVQSNQLREDSIVITNTFAHLYYRLNNVDSTIYYCSKLIKSQSLNAQLNGYNILANLHMHNNQTKDAYDAIVMSTRLSDSIRKINTPYEIRQLSAIYNYQIRERENNKLKQKAQKHSLYLYITISGICILVLLLFIFHQQSRQKIHKKQQLIDNYAETILELRDSINSNASSHSVIINELFEGRFSILNDIGNTFADLSGSITDQKLLYKEVKEIISRFENPKTLTELEEIINRYKNNLMQKFRDDFPSLSNDEYQQVCYHYAGFSPKFISLLMHQKFPTIYKRRTRIKEKIMASDSAYKEELIANLN